MREAREGLVGGFVGEGGWTGAGRQNWEIEARANSGMSGNGGSEKEMGVEGGQLGG